MSLLKILVMPSRTPFLDSTISPGIIFQEADTRATKRVGVVIRRFMDLILRTEFKKIRTRIKPSNSKGLRGFTPNLGKLYPTKLINTKDKVMLCEILWRV
jgi:Tfp pilus assembly ATPase PilU